VARLDSETTDILKAGRTSAKGGITLFVGLVLSTLISTVGTIIVARMLSPEDFGLFSKAIVPPALIGLFWYWGINDALVKYIAQLRAKNQTGELKTFVISGILLNSGLSLLLSVITFFLAGFLADNIFLRPQLKILIQVASVMLLGSCLVNTSQAIFTGFERFEYRSFLLIFQAIIQTALSILFIFLGYGVYGVVLGVTLSYVIAAVAGLVVTYFKFYSRTEEKPNKNDHVSIRKTLKTMLNYGYPLGLSQILFGFLPQFYLFLIAIYCSDLTIGNYQIATKFIVLITFLTTTINATLFPAFSKLDSRKAIEKLKVVFRSSTKYVALLTFPLIAGIVVLSEPLILLFFGESYGLAPTFLSLTVIVNMVGGFGYTTLFPLLMGQGLTRKVLKIYLVELSIGIPSGLVLIPQFGVMGLIATNWIAKIPSLLVGLFWIYKQYQFTIDWSFSLKSCFASALAAAIAYMSIVVLKSPSWIELAVGGVVFFICYLILIPTLRVMNLADIESLRQIFKGLGIVTYLFDKLLNIVEKLLKFRLAEAPLCQH
jgi:O-antigen/teichoic acid export membrane protein